MSRQKRIGKKDNMGRNLIIFVLVSCLVVVIIFSVPPMGMFQPAIAGLVFLAVTLPGQLSLWLAQTISIGMFMPLDAGGGFMKTATAQAIVLNTLFAGLLPALVGLIVAIASIIFRSRYSETSGIQKRFPSNAFLIITFVLIGQLVGSVPILIVICLTRYY